MPQAHNVLLEPGAARAVEQQRKSLLGAAQGSHARADPEVHDGYQTREYATPASRDQLEPLADQSQVA
jgi:hypothetical protein